MEILVIDGQGGGVGRSLVEELKKRYPDYKLIAVGTNSAATANMLRGGYADAAATGENAVVFNSSRADVIVGPAGIVMANAMYGEITPKMAEAISSSPAELVLIPMNHCRATIVGVAEKRLSEYILDAVTFIGQIKP